MNCPSCHKEIREGSQFCAYCGKAVSATREPDRPQEPRRYQADRRKGFSYIPYKYIETEAELWEGRLSLSRQVTWFGLLKRSRRQATLELDGITSVEKRTRFNFWDTAFALLFFFAGIFVHWPWFLLTAIFLYNAWGAEISITYAGEVYRIPVEGHEMDALIQDIRATQNSPHSAV